MKGFCEKCRDLVDFAQKEMEKEFEIRGKKKQLFRKGSILQ